MAEINDRKIIEVPKEAHALVQQLYKDILSYCQERGALIESYARERHALDEKYAPLTAELLGRINETKLKASAMLCEACGIPYDPECGYSVDAQYLEFGVAFVVVMPRENGARFDGLPNDMPPAGTRLN